jgi:GH25 family lysozyme M1 (1,4-beta-N-acetylmuramidase)
VSDTQAGDGRTGTATTAADPGPPYLIVDQYPGDSGAHPPWGTLVATAGYCGAILKAWDGKQYNDGGWFATNWPAVKDAGGDRYGVSWIRGAYLYLEFAADGAAQADAYLAAIDRAGGWDSGDIVPIIDVELGKATNPNNFNAKASAQQIVDCATGCAERIKSVTGSRVMLYGRGAMRDRGITSHMGCDLVWNPSWTATMVTNGLQTWGLEDIALWQYCGDNTSALPNYPHSVPGFGKIDISVYVRGAQKPTLEMMRTSLLR